VELEQNGFPPRPDSNQVKRYARWKRMVTATRITPELTPTAIYNGLPRNWKMVRSAASTVTGTTPNWSGFAFSVAAGTFAVNNSEVCAQWTIPAVQQAPGVCSSTSYQSSQWVGFDGAPLSSSTDVMQAGTSADASCRHRTTTATYSAWFEWFPAAEVQVSNFTVSPGDGMIGCVYYTTSSGSPSGLAVLLNQTTDQGVEIGFSSPPGTTFIGDSAEWVMERPTVDGSLADLPNFGYFGFNDGLATNGGSVSYTPGARLRGVTSEEIAMVCPPWNPSTTCSGRGFDISTFNLNVGNEGDNTLWFTAQPPAGP
jgi:hypothetical protein